MRITMSKDGRPRMDFKATFRLDTWDIASYVTNHIYLESNISIGDDEPFDEYQRRKNKHYLKETKKLRNKQILEIVYDGIAQDGCTDRMGYVIGDNDLSEVCDVVEQIIKKKFKGFSIA